MRALLLPTPWTHSSQALASGERCIPYPHVCYTLLRHIARRKPSKRKTAKTHSSCLSSITPSVPLADARRIKAGAQSAQSPPVTTTVYALISVTGVPISDSTHTVSRACTHLGAQGKRGNCKRRACRRVNGEALRIDLVHSGKVADVGEPAVHDEGKLACEARRRDPQALQAQSHRIVVFTTSGHVQPAAVRMASKLRMTCSACSSTPSPMSFIVCVATRESA